MPLLTSDQSARNQSSAESPPVAVDVAPDGSRTVHVGTWALSAAPAEDEPRVRDIDLAERLGYERPRKIRDLIERLCREGKLNDSELRPVVGRSGGRPAKEFWLTEAQALKVVAKSETAKADALLDEVIRVFILARKGLLPVVAAPALDAAVIVDALNKVLAPFAAAMAAQNDRLAALEDQVRNAGLLSPERTNAIKARVSSVAGDLAKFGVEKRRAASLRIHKRLKMRVGWYGDHCRLDNMPARHEAEVLRELEIIEHEARGAIASSRQRTLFAVPANVNRARPSA